MADKQPEEVPGQMSIPMRNRTVPPPTITMLTWALGDIERVIDSVFDSYEDVTDQLVLLGLLQEQRKRLGQITAAIEARCAGAMPKARIFDPERGVQANREQRYITTWDSRRLLHDLLYAQEAEAVAAELEAMEETDRAQAETDMDRYVWKFVDFVLTYGAYAPRVTPLRENKQWTTEDIGQYRKTERGARKVTVTLTTEKDADDDATDVESDQPDAAGGPGGVADSGDVEAAG